MKNLQLYQIDAFTDKLFQGNPAAVIPLQTWLPAELMQNIAMENNLAETAFFIPGKQDGNFDLRWFTPTIEMDLCGHATLASAYVLFEIMGIKNKQLTLQSKSGPLIVSKNDDLISMDFPSWKPERFEDYPAELQDALGVDEIVGVYKHRDLVVELNSEEDVKTSNPDFGAIKKTGYKIIITAPGSKRSTKEGRPDFVSRFFAPTVGIDEDPVTGSAHSQLIPFWSEKLGKKKMIAEQLSKRGGRLRVELQGERVIMAGSCVFYMKGEIRVDF